jgi:hypothetical protein
VRKRVSQDAPWRSTAAEWMPPAEMALMPGKGGSTLGEREAMGLGTDRLDGQSPWPS